MKLPLEWLREQIPTSLTDEQIAERLTATGTAVEKATASRSWWARCSPASSTPTPTGCAC